MHLFILLLLPACCATTINPATAAAAAAPYRVLEQFPSVSLVLQRNVSKEPRKPLLKLSGTLTATTTGMHPITAPLLLLLLASGTKGDSAEAPTKLENYLESRF